MVDQDIEQAVTRDLERRMQNSSLASPQQPVVHQQNLIESTLSHEQHNSSQKQSERQAELPQGLYSLPRQPVMQGSIEATALTALCTCKWLLHTKKL